MAYLWKYAFMRTTVDLPDHLYRELKVLAATRGMPLRDVVQEFVELGLRGPMTQKRDEVRDVPRFPSISIGKPYPKALTSNAALFEILNDSK
jgi:hypothetical protein